jgi:membrane protein implicated in regulation of membrane protease activity
VLSITSLLLFRKPLMRRFGLSNAPTHPIDSMVGESCVVIDPPGADGHGKVELRGATWSARGATGLARGQRCRVQRVDGLTLWIQPEGDAP